MRRGLRLAGVAVAALLSVVLAVPAANVTAKTDPAYDRFVRRSQLLLDNDGASTLDASTQKSRLDRERLEKKKVLSDDIGFMQELTDFSNDVLEASKTPQASRAPSLSLKSTLRYKITSRKRPL